MPTARRWRRGAQLSTGTARRGRRCDQAGHDASKSTGRGERVRRARPAQREPDRAAVSAGRNQNMRGTSEASRSAVTWPSGISHTGRTGRHGRELEEDRSSSDRRSRSRSVGRRSARVAGPRADTDASETDVRSGAMSSRNRRAGPSCDCLFVGWRSDKLQADDAGDRANVTRRQGAGDHAACRLVRWMLPLTRPRRNSSSGWMCSASWDSGSARRYGTRPRLIGRGQRGPAVAHHRRCR